MELSKHFSEEHIQDIVDGTFTGDMSHLDACPVCRKRREEYALVSHLINRHSVTFTELPDIANRAWNVIQRDRRADRTQTLQYALLVCACIGVVAVCLIFLISIGMSLAFVALVLATIGGYLLISHVEIREVTSSTI